MRLPAASCAPWPASSAARRPRIGGSAGRLARRNAMRHPGRTAATAAALMIGVALVTAVTVVAQGLRGHVRGLARAPRAGDARSWRRPTAGRRSTPRSSGRSPAPGVTAVSSLRQDGALAFGEKEGVNAVDPATVSELFAYDLKAGDEAASPASDATARSSTRAGRPSTA